MRKFHILFNATVMCGWILPQQAFGFIYTNMGDEKYNFPYPEKPGKSESIKPYTELGDLVKNSFESVCYSTDHRSHKQFVANLSLIKSRENRIIRDMKYLGYSDAQILTKLEEHCPEEDTMGRDTSDKYIADLYIMDYSLALHASSQREHQKYANRCSFLGTEALPYDEYSSYLKQTYEGSMNPYGHSVPGDGGYGHSAKCEANEGPDCTPHTHSIILEGRKEVARREGVKAVLDHKAVVGDLGTTTTTTSVKGNMNGGLSGVIKLLGLSGEVGTEFAKQWETTSGGITKEEALKIYQDRYDKIMKLPDDQLFVHIKKDDETFVKLDPQPPEDTSNSTKPQSTEPKETSTEPQSTKPKETSTEPQNTKTEDPATSQSPKPEAPSEENTTFFKNTDFMVPCGKVVDPNKFTIKEDKVVAETEKAKKEKDKKCIESHGMTCAEFEKWVKSNIKEDKTIIDAVNKQKEKDDECRKKWGMTCREYDEFLKLNVKDFSTGGSGGMTVADQCAKNPHLAFCQPDYDFTKKPGYGDSSDGSGSSSSGSSGIGTVQPGGPIGSWQGR